MRVEDVEGIELLRRALDEAGYGRAGFSRLLGQEIPPRPTNWPLWVRRLPAQDPLATQIKLLYLGVAVTRPEAEHAFARLGLERLTAMGVLRAGDEQVEGAVSVTPIGELLVAGDWPESPPQHADYVMPVAGPTVVLANITARRPVATALDVGTGSGVQALLAARHAREVVAVDINARALEYAAFNALLNDARNVTLREGNLFEPVEGDSFDLIVSNPPYVISPDSTYAFRDSGLPGHSFSEGFVRAIPAHLNEGGLAHLLVDWIVRPDEHWSAPLRRWVEGSGCDAILLHYKTMAALDYAAQWNGALEPDPDAYGAAIDRWLEYFRAEDIERIGWGAVVLRRRAGSNWTWAHDYVSARHLDPSGHHTLRLVAAQDFLQSHDDDALLETVLTLADDHALEMTFELQDGRRVIRRATLSLQTGFRFRASVDAFAAELLAHLDGTRPLRDVLAAVTGELPALQGEQVEAGALRVVRELIESGFVVAAA